jgi:Holliday junction resolvase RusA-like endonuclease
MTDSIRIVIPTPLPSLNETQRMHRMAYHRLGKQWALAIKMLAPKLEPATGKRRVVIERRSTRELDKDNAYGGAKVVVDALKKLGLILDDNSANLDLEVVQSKCGASERASTIITIDCPLTAPNIV